MPTLPSFSQPLSPKTGVYVGNDLECWSALVICLWIFLPEACVSMLSSILVQHHKETAWLFLNKTWNFSSAEGHTCQDLAVLSQRRPVWQIGRWQFEEHPRNNKLQCSALSRLCYPSPWKTLKMQIKKIRNEWIKHNTPLSFHNICSWWESREMKGGHVLLCCGSWLHFLWKWWSLWWTDMIKMSDSPASEKEMECNCRAKYEDQLCIFRMPLASFMID